MRRSNDRGRHPGRKKFTLLSFLFLGFVAVLLLQNYILMGCAHVGFNYFLGKKLGYSASYETISASKQRVTLCGIEVADQSMQCLIDQADIALSFGWSFPFVHSHVSIKHPEITLFHQKEKSKGESNIPLQALGLFQCDLDDGVLFLEKNGSSVLKDPFYFSWKSVEKGGKLTMGFEPFPDEVSVDVVLGERILVDVKVDQFDCGYLREFLSFFQEELLVEEMGGRVSGLLTLELNHQLGIERIFVEGDLKSFAAQWQERNFQSEHVHFDLIYPPSEEMESGFVTSGIDLFRRALWHFEINERARIGDLSTNEVRIGFDPSMRGEMNIHGEIHTANGSVPIHVQGQYDLIDPIKLSFRLELIESGDRISSIDVQLEDLDQLRVQCERFCVRTVRIFEPFYHSLLPGGFDLVDGVFSLDLLLSLKEKQIQRIDARQAHFENLVVSGSDQMKVDVPSLVVTGGIQKREKEWEFDHLHYGIKEGRIAPYEITRITGEGVLNGRMVDQIAMAASYRGMKLNLTGFVDNSSLQIEAQAAHGGAVLHMTSALERVHDDYALHGKVFVGEGELSFGASYGPLVKSLWFNSSLIALEQLNPFLKVIPGSISLHGKAAVDGVFKENLLSGRVDLEGFSLDHPEIKVAFKEEKQQALFAWDVNLNRKECELHLKQGRIDLPKMDASLVDFSSDLIFNGENVKIDALSFRSKGIVFNGRGEGRHSKKEGMALKISSDFIDHPESGIRSKNVVIEGALLPDFTWKMKTRWEEIFSQRIPALRIKEGMVDLKGDASFNQVAIALECHMSGAYKETLCLKVQNSTYSKLKNELSFDLDLASKKEKLLCSKGKIKKQHAGYECIFTQSDLFSLKPEIKELTLDSRCRLEQCRVNLSCSLEELKTCLQKAGNIPWIALDEEGIRFFEELNLQGAIGLKLQLLPKVNKMTCRIESKNVRANQLPFPDLELELRREGNDVVIESAPNSQADVDIHFCKDGKKIVIPIFRFSFAPLSINCSFEYQNEGKKLKGDVHYLKVDLGWLNPQLYQKYPDFFSGFVRVSGPLLFSFDEGKIAGNAHLLLDDSSLSKENLMLAQKNRIVCSYDSEQGLVIPELDLALISGMGKEVLMESSCKEIRLDVKSKELSVQKCRYFVRSPLLYCLTDWGVMPRQSAAFCSSDLEGEFDASFGKNRFEVRGKMKDGEYILSDHPLLMKEIGYLVNNEEIVFKTQAYLGEEPLKVYGELKNQKGVVNIASPFTPGIKVQVDLADPCCIIQTVQGAIGGVKAHFTQEKEHLAGYLRLNFSEMGAYLPHSILDSIKEFQLGKGYLLEGKLFFKQGEEEKMQFLGRLKGEEFELLGCHFDEMLAEVELNEEECIFKNLSLVDPAISLAIKQVHYALGKNVHIPLVRIQDFKPSYLRDAGTLLRKELDPLVIRNISIYDIRGEVDNLSSFRGIGNMNFTNQEKQRSNLFMLPLEILKNLGLDWEILTPVIGEVDFMLENQKIYLTQLRNAYSSQKRSEFYLPHDEQKSYIDLKGNLHVDIKMKQNVLLKITEPFTICIRGNLDKPQYSLK